MPWVRQNARFRVPGVLHCVPQAATYDPNRHWEACPECKRGCRRTGGDQAQHPGTSSTTPGSRDFNRV